MRRSTIAAGALLLLCALDAVDGASACDVADWFRSSQIYVNLVPSREFVVEIPLSDAYWSQDRHRGIMGTNPQLSLKLTTVDGRLVSVSVACVLKRRKIDCIIPESLMPDVGGELQSAQVEIPRDLLLCNEQPSAADVLVTIDGYADSNGNPSTAGELLLKKGATFSKRVDLGSGHADASGNSGITIDFDLHRKDDLMKGKIKSSTTLDANGQPESSRLREGGSELELSGSFATKADTYFDSVRLAIALEGRTTDLTGNSFVRIASWSAFFRPEVTTDLDDRDYVYGVQFGVVPAIAAKTLNRRFAQPFPFISLGIEEVDPDRRENGTVPENYLRAVGRLKWKLYLASSAAFTVDGDVRYNIDDVAGLERWTRRWDFSILLLRDRSWKPFIKYSRGESAPLFEFHEEAIAGVSFGDALGGR